MPTLPTAAVQVRLTEDGGGTRMELGFVFASKEHMERLERWGARSRFFRNPSAKWTPLGGRREEMSRVTGFGEADPSAT
jgi:hypothetical protein